MSVVKFPFGRARGAWSRKPRRSKNGTPEERAAKSAAEAKSPATVIDLAAPAGAAPALRVVATEDPALVLIAKKRAANVAHCEAIDAEEAAENRYDPSSPAAAAASDNCLAACHLVNKIDWALATTPPTTLAGVAAVLRFANEIEDDGNEWPNTDTVGCDGWHYKLRATMATAVETIMRERAQPQERPKEKAEAGSTLVEFIEALRGHFTQEFARGRDLDQIFGDLEDTYRRAQTARQKFLEQRGDADR